MTVEFIPRRVLTLILPLFISWTCTPHVSPHRIPYTGTQGRPGKQGQVAELRMDRTVTSSQLECKCSWVVFECFDSSTSSTLVHTCHWMPSISTIHSGRWLLKVSILFALQTCSPWPVSSVYAGPFLLSVRTNQGSQASPFGCMWAGYVLLHFLNLQWFQGAVTGYSAFIPCASDCFRWPDVQWHSDTSISANCRSCPGIHNRGTPGFSRVLNSP